MRDRIVIIGIYISLFLALQTVSSTYISDLDAEDWGLLTKFPISYWTGFLLTNIILSYLMIKSKLRYVNIMVLLVLIYLYVVPIMIVENQEIGAQSYHPSSEVNPILSTGYLKDNPNPPMKFPDQPAGLMSYYNWPSFIYLEAVIMLVLKTKLDVLIKYFPIFTITLYSLVVYSILRLKLKPEYSSLGVIWFLGSYWYSQHYFGPQSIAFLYYLMLIYFLIKIFYQENIDTDNKKNRFIFLFLYLSMILLFTHVLTPIFLLLAVFSIYLIDKLIFKMNCTNLIKKILITLTVLILGYNIYIAHSFIGKGVITVYDSISNPSNIPIYKEVGRIDASTLGTITYFSSWAIVLINSIPILIILYMILYKKNYSRFDVFNVTLIIFLFVLSLITKYGPEAPYRAFMFSLINISYISMVNIVNREDMKKTTMFLLVLLLLLHMPADYGSDTFRLTTSSELAGTKFLALYSNDYSNIHYKYVPYIRYFNVSKYYHFIRIGGAPFTNLDLQGMTDNMLRADYIVSSKVQSNYYKYYGVDTIESIYNSYTLRIYNGIYTNGKFYIYYKQ